MKWKLAELSADFGWLATKASQFGEVGEGLAFVLIVLQTLLRAQDAALVKRFVAHVDQFVRAETAKGTKLK